MSKPTLLLRRYVLPHSRAVNTSSNSRTSTSPQRRSPAAPAAAARLKPFLDIPGPLALPMLRHSAHVLPRIGSFHHSVGLGLLEGIRDRYGDLVRLAKGSRKRPVLYVFHPQLMSEVYESGVTEAPRWEKSPLQEQRKTVGTHCPFHGDESKAIWLGIQALLEDRSLVKNYEQAFDDIATDATRRLGDLRHVENALNEELETEVHRWALETIGMLVFGIRLGCLDGPTHVPNEDNRGPEKTSIEDHDAPHVCSLSKRAFEDLTPAERLVRVSRQISDGSYLVRSERTLRPEFEEFGSALKALDTHFSLTDHFLMEALKALNEVQKPEQVLLNKLRPLERRILPLAADILLAGVEPLAQTALSMFYQLSLHAARQQRAHDEVSWAAASADAGAGYPDRPYIAACAREAMRLMPVTGGVVRRNKEDIVVGGYEVPAGVDIVLAHGVTSKLESEWGRAKAFIPERWCTDGQPLKASRAHSYASMPFGESCPASGVVGTMLASLSTRVLDKYRLEWHGPSPNMVTVGVNRLQHPYYFVLQNAA